jgi:hypothetical protein
MECSHETASFRQVKGGRENTAPILKAKNFTGKNWQTPTPEMITGHTFHLTRIHKLWTSGREERHPVCNSARNEIQKMFGEEMGYL